MMDNLGFEDSDSDIEYDQTDTSNSHYSDEGFPELDRLLLNPYR